MINKINKPKVSVIMSVYMEPLEWLHKSIDSILNQTFKDFEFIIICDNPEYKEGIELLNEYCKKDDRIIVIYNEQNIGLTKSLNKGLEIARGRYIARMDADDISLPKRFQRQIKYMEQNPNVAACGTYAKTIDEKGKMLSQWVRETDPLIIRSQMLFKSPIIHPSAFFRRIVNGAPIVYDEEYVCAQDYALWASLCGKYDLFNVNEILLLYRLSGSQISSKKKDLQQYYSRKIIGLVASNLNIVLKEKDIEAISVLTQSYGSVLTLKEIENFILSFVNNIKENNYVSEKKVANYLILLYCNYLPNYLSFSKSINRFFIMSWRCHSFSFYNLFSLISKFIR